MSRDVEHFFMCFLSIWTSSLKKLFSNFFIGSLIWGQFSFLSCLYILVINYLSAAYLATKKNEFLSFAEMDGTGEYHLR
jgi:hypothetical protein